MKDEQNRFTYRLVGHRLVTMVLPLIISATPTDDLVRVRDRARRQRARNPRRPVVIELAGGTYRLARTLELTAADSGVVWRSREGERAVLSGGDLISDWKVGEVNGKPCWIAAVEPGRVFTQLWADNRRRKWSRWPAEGFFHFAGLDGQSDTGFAWTKGPQRAQFYPGQIEAHWQHRDDVRITAYQLWFETHHRIADVDTERHLVHFRSPSIGSLFDEKNEMARFICENVFEMLREPGTWYLDHRAGSLYYLPMEGEAPDVTCIIAPRLQELVVLAGTADAPVRDVHFEHIAFHHADFDRAPESTGFVQAAYDIPGALRLRWAENCVLFGCEVAHVGQYGIEVEAGSINPVIAACTLHDLGAGGIRVASEELEVHDASVGVTTALVRPESIAATVIDCVIRDTGHRHPSSVGILLGNSGHHRLLHNHLHDLPYSGISSGWIWGYKPTRTIGIQIEHNHIHHVNHLRLLSDNGAIYTLGRHPGGRVRGNWISDIGCYGYGGWGLYPDEGSSEIVLARNVVLRTKHAAFHMHYGRGCQVRDNLFAASRDAHVKLSRAEDHRSLTFTGNVVTAADGSWDAALGSAPQQVLWRDNLFHDPRRTLLSPTQITEFQARGQHHDVRIADPLLRDADGGDPVPRADTPAKGLGRIVRFASAAGIRPCKRLPYDFADYDLPRAKPYAIIETIIEKQGEPEKLPSGNTLVRFRVTWRNPGLVKATAAATLMTATGTISGEHHVDESLKPGAEVVREVSVEVPAGEPIAELQSVPQAKPAMPHLSFVRLAVAGRNVTLPRLANISDPAGVVAMLDQQPWEETRFGALGGVCAKFRFAVTEEAFVLQAVVSDARIHHGSQPWTGSCLEIYTAPAEGGKTCGQVAIQPELLGVPAKTWAVVGGLRQESFATRTTRTATGYELETIVPLALLGLNGNQTGFRLEIAVSAARGQGAQVERSAWMNASEAWIHGEAMAQVTVG